MNEVIITKICKKCEQAKSLDGFHNHPTTKDHKKHICILCEREYGKQSYLRNRTARIAKTREWQTKNPDKVRLFQTKWRSRQECKTVSHEKIN